MTRINGFSAKLIPELHDLHDGRLVLKFTDREDQPLNIFFSQDDGSVIMNLLYNFFTNKNRIINPRDVDTFGELSG